MAYSNMHHGHCGQAKREQESMDFLDSSPTKVGEE